MAVDSKQKKRKGADDATVTAKKRKNDKPPSKQPDGASTGSRKRASDFFDPEIENDEAQAPAVQLPKAKKAKTVEVAPAQKDAPTTKTKPKSKREVPPADPSPELAEADDVWADSEDDDVADQSAALLQGFSSSDEEGDGTDAVAEVPTIPTDKALAKKLKAAATDDGKEPGVVYVGRVPHGFFEHQMRAYFSQFGDITRLRLSRNKKTGRSKHYAFIEFASREVAKIVAATMNKYLLFGHILQVRTLAPEEVHPELFKGANKRFKVVPRNKIQGRQLRLPKEREVWEKRIENENRRRKAKEEKLKALGYEMQLPELTSTKSIPFRKQKEEGAFLITDTAATEETQALARPRSKKSSNPETAIAEGAPEPGTKSKTRKVKGKAK